MSDFVFELQRFAVVNNHDDEYDDDYDDTYDDDYDDYYDDTEEEELYNNSDSVKVNGTSGDDWIENWGSYVTIDGGAGNDEIDNYGSDVSINGGEGNDWIDNDYYSDYLTINGGKGNDTIINNYGYGDYILFKYAKGDGNDYIYGFNATSTLSISGGTYSTAKSGSNIIVTVGDGKISLIGAASLSTVNIKGTAAETNSWKLSGTTATYGTSSKTLFTVKGVKSIDGLSVNGKVVTVSKASLNKKAVTISGTGYTLKLGSDVTKSTSTAASWSLSGTTATYKSAKKTAGYTLSDNKISYVTASGGSTLATVSGVKSLSGLSLSNKTVTVSNASLNQKAVTISDGYTLKLGSDVTKSTSTAATWSLSGTTATYKSAKKTAGYTLSDNKISYVTASGGSTLATVSGVKSLSGLSLSNKTVTVSNASLNQKAVTISDGYTLKLGSDVTKSTSTAATWSLSGTTATYKSAKKTAGYTLSDNKISYVTASGGSTLATMKGVKDKSGLSVDGKTITATTAALNKKVTVSGSGYEFNFAAGDYKKTSITGSANADSIGNAGSNVKISLGAGNDSIDNFGDTVTISGGAGNDTIYNYGDNVSISGGAGNDFLYNSGYDYVTISSGTGNDTIELDYGNYNLFKYTSGDGNDIIYGFDETSTLQIGGGTGSYSTTKSGKNVIVTVGDGKISLMGAASLSSVNIDGKAPATNSWKLNGTTATYGTTSKTLVTVKGVTSTSGLSLSNKTVTVSKAALGTSNVSITGGTGYTLKLADDVSQSAKTTKAWTPLDGTTATYKQTKSAYYTLASNSKSISYKKSTSSTLTTVSGVKSTDGLSISGKVVTVSNASLNKKAVTITNGYTLKLGSDVTKSKTTAAKWTLSNSTATYKSAKKTTGYKLADNKISYVTAGGGNTLATVKGVKSKPTLSDGVITLTTSNISTAKKVSVSGNYTFNFAAGNYNKSSISGTANADTIVVNGTNLSINGGAKNDTIKVLGSSTTVIGGKGNDSLISNSSGGNVFVYNSGDGNDVITNFAASDKLSIASSATYSVSGLDVVFSVGDGSITVKDAKDKTFTYYDSSGTKTYKPAGDSKGITLPGSYAETDFDLSTVTGGSKIVTIDASAVKHGLNITGNSLANSIIGGSGNDTLDGGSDKKNDTLRGSAGADVFYYVKNNGKDVIADYTEEDKIYIRGSLNGAPTDNGRDFILKISGGGQITLKDAYKKGYGITYFENGIEHDWKDGKQTVTFNDNTVVISDKYWKDTFDLTNFGNRKIIDAMAVSHNIYIKGNGEVNDIRGGTGDDTLEGGRGDDILEGGSGKDVFVYTPGDDNDTIVDYAPNNDKIKIKGTISFGDYYTKEDGNDSDVVLRVGSGRITVKNAIGRRITIEDETGKSDTRTYVSKPLNGNSNPDVDNAWFMDDEDNYIGADNQLSSIVQTQGAAFTTNLVPSPSSLVPANDSLPALTYSAKK